jgi:hypothetical protein
MVMTWKAEALADVLMKIYTDRKKRFILTQNEFTAMSGKRKFRKKFLRAVDACLREKGYVLIDMHKERQMIGVLRIETIAQWDIPDLHDDADEHQFSEEEDDESNSE